MSEQSLSKANQSVEVLNYSSVKTTPPLEMFAARQVSLTQMHQCRPGRKVK